MLCNLKNNRRPDKELQKKLVSLAYGLVFLTFSVILFLLYPQYQISLIIALLLSSSVCLYLTIKTIGTAEEAMSYGGFANEIIRNGFEARRIENSHFEPVLQNEAAKDLLNYDSALNFFAANLSDTRQNRNALNRLQTAIENLTTEKVALALRLHSENTKIFSEEEWYEVSIRPIYLKKTDIFEGPYSIKAIKKDTYLFWNCKNITAEKNMEQIFHEERKSMHDFLDFLPVGLYIIDKNHQLEYVNHAFAQMIGLSREELIGHNLAEFTSQISPLPSGCASWKGKIYFQDLEQQTQECYVFHENFREAQQIKTRGVAICNLPNDEKLQSDLNTSYDQISWLFDFAPVGIIFITEQGIIQQSNHIACAFLEQTPEKINQHSIFTHINLDDLPKLKHEIAKVSSGEAASASVDVHIKQEQAEKVAVIYISPMKKFYSAHNNEHQGLVLYLIDATKQKSLELQFAQAQKMQAIGQLAGGVAHDFNNLLTAMIGFCDLLLQRHSVGDPSFADLTQIKQNANRAAGLVRQLLAFSRKQPLKPKLIDITEKFTELNLMLKRILGEQIILKFYHSSELGFVRVDPTQFSQVILNLAINAKDAMNGQGTININTHVESISEPYQFGADTIKPGEFVVIDVVDTGCGIPTENLTRIFDPFFSTKQNVVGSGTGLGLAMVYGIVRQTEGFIKVNSIVGQGTTFSVYLPRFESNTDITESENLPDKQSIKNPDGTPVLTVKETVKSPLTVNGKMIFGLNVSMIDRSFNPADPQVSSIRILFVEDEDSVRTFAARALKKKGYDIICCNSSENALEQLEKDKNFDLLLTDMMLPGMSGTELAAIVKEKIPAIKIILASGYSEEIAKQGLSNSDEFEFLAKPFSLGDLTQKVFDVLNQNGKQNA